MRSRCTRLTATERDRATLTRSEEELNIGKREVSRGEARVSKHVETEHVSEPVTRRREEVVIERRPVEADARADATIGESGEIRVPLTEEEVVVEKRPVVKEELVIGKRVVEERDVVETDVRRERFDIDDNVTPGSSTAAARAADEGERLEDRRMADIDVVKKGSHTWMWILLAVVIALILWFVVSGSQERRRPGCDSIALRSTCSWRPLTSRALDDAGWSRPPRQGRLRPGGD